MQTSRRRGARATLLVGTLWVALAAPAAQAAVIYVRAGAGGANNGTSWNDAYRHLSEALAASNAGDEIWVAAGTYRPDETTASPGGTGVRETSFVLRSGVALYGGFAGTETQRSQRPVDASGRPTLATILSGDLDGNDGANFANYGENSYNVLTASGVDATAVLDGFEVRGGNANHASDAARRSGGGLYASAGGPTIRLCRFVANRAASAGAMYFAGFCGVTLERVEVTDNTGTTSHGGARVEGTAGGPYANVLVQDCTFARNTAPATAGGGGGGFSTSAAHTRVRNSVFMENVAARGAGMGSGAEGSLSIANCSFLRNVANGPATFCAAAGLNIAGNLDSVVVQNCLFAGNRALNGLDGRGGAIRVDAPADDLRIANCLFVGNAAERGGAVHSINRSTTLRNCTLVSNAAVLAGGGVYLDDPDGNGTIANCIVWGNSDGSGDPSAAQITVIGPAATVAYCLVEGGYAGTGNTDADPRFRVYPSPGADGNWDGVNDSYGDLRPAADSPAIDAGSNALVETDRLDLDGDGITGEPLPIDYGGRGRFHEIITTANTGAGAAPLVDIGAYESLAGPVLVDATPSAAWAGAEMALQDGLALARAYTDEVTEVWVAAGIYKPDIGAGIAPGDRTASFRPPSDLAIYGGFAGNESARAERDITVNATVLSGDLGVVDADWPPNSPLPASWQDNAFHVVDLSNVTNAVLDGLTITHGVADGVNDASRGGGILAGQFSTTSATVRGCRIESNFGRTGGGAAIWGAGSVAFENCDFVANNSNADTGGAIHLNAGGQQVVRNCRFERNRSIYGGAVGVGFGSALVSDSTFLQNAANGGGGAVICWRTTATFVRCTFEDNSTQGVGGALANSPNPDPAIRLFDCTFRRNHAAGSGGAIGLVQVHEITAANCTFVGNTAAEGGAVRHLSLDERGGVGRWVNCTFAENVASASGGGIWCGGTAPSSPAIGNCILWGNRDPSGTTAAAQITTVNGAQVVNYSVVQGGWSGAGGVGVRDYAPLLRRMPDPGPDGLWNGVGDDFGDLRPRYGSPAIDLGNSALLPADAGDLDGDANTAEALPLDLAGAARAVDQPCLADGGVGNPGPPDAGAYEAPPPPPQGPVVYVRAGSGGANNGASWADAFDDLSEALCAAGQDDAALELWVAAGTYAPLPADFADPRSASFALVDGLEVYGGFVGNETLRTQRDAAANPTILSGDRAGNDDENDFPNGSSWADNVYHVLNAPAGTLGPGAVLDGFTIRGGNANLAGDPRGGGMLNDANHPTVRNCVFEFNHAHTAGGAIYGSGSLSYIENCTFRRNAASIDAGADGGAVFTSATLPRAIRGCTFEGNACRDGGGALRLSGGTTHVVDCRFVGNDADRGGGLYMDGATTALVVNGVFRGNRATQHGGGLSNVGADLTLVNCAFVGNQADHPSATALGGGLFNNDFSTAIRSCTFAANRADAGGGVYLSAQAPTFANCVLWGNFDDGGGGAQIARNPGNPGAPSVRYSIVQDGWSGAGQNNLTGDPLFVTPPAPGPDNQWGTPDDLFDLRLMAGSPGIDSGENASVPPDASDLDCDGNTREQTPLDLKGARRIAGGPPAVVDRGAYEGDASTAGRLYVRQGATGLGDGSDWANAFPELRDALAFVAADGCVGVEIWVAAGTYAPAGPGGSRASSFELTDEITLYGGFAGTETELSQRDWLANPTVLTGDLDGDGQFEDNCYHVVTGSGTTTLAVLDGFIISGGNADGGVASGGGLVTTAGGPLLRNCTIAGNRGSCVTGLDGVGGNLALSGVTVRDNLPAGQFQLGLSQGRLDLLADSTLANGRALFYGADVSGPGSLVLAPGSELHVAGVAPCGAERVVRLSGSLAATTIFLPAQGESSARWEIPAPGAELRDCVVEGALTRWIIAPTGTPPARLTWAGNTLEADESSAGRAAARFHGGGPASGTLTITGTIYDRPPAEGGTAQFTGELLVCRVGAFAVRETGAASNVLEFSSAPRLTPVGGYLASAGSGLAVAGLQIAQMTFSPAQQDSGGGPGPLTSFDANSTIALTAAAGFSVAPAVPPRSDTVLRAALRGTGEVVIASGAQLTLAGDAVLNLSGLPDDACAPGVDPGAPPGGVIHVNGRLLVQDRARVLSSNVRVNLLALGSDSTLVHNDISLLGDAQTGFGGEFFAADEATIACNVIRSDGDRYLDLDPDPLDGETPVLFNNRIYVTIRQGAGSAQGELLELRAYDYDNGVNFGRSGAYLLADSPGFHDTWALEELEVRPNAKVNLTNRPGFVFQPAGVTVPEALYVKRLVLRSGAVLNTGLQRLYYQTLVSEAGSQIVDIPVLGFSLKVIEMEDDTEFAVRVRTRLRDPADVQPAPPAAPREGRIVREPEFPGAANHVMRMSTQTASSVAAHGAFARAGEDSVLVDFFYQFPDACIGNAELIVYLSDRPEPRDPADPTWPQHYLEVARVYPPAEGRSGRGDNAGFARFRASFSRGALNFTRGTYVELELRGVQTCVKIDKWDPAVTCQWATQCGDVDATEGLNNLDYLALCTEYGRASAGQGNECADRLSGDGYIDLSDILAWDSVLFGWVEQPPGTLCDMPPPAGAAGAARTDFVDGLLIAGKTGSTTDMLYRYDGAGAPLPSVRPVARNNGQFSFRGNGRLVLGPTGHVCQLHATQGLYDVETGELLLAPGEGSFNGEPVHVGQKPTEAGVVAEPILDAAFHEGALYVAPVTVVVTTPVYHTYRAVARLDLSNGGEFNVAALYGVDPGGDGCTNTDVPDASECNLQGVREIEVGPDGTVYVLAAREVNANDWLLIYPPDGGSPLRVLLTAPGLAPGLAAPTAMLLSRDGMRLYVATGLSGTDITQTRVWRFDITGGGIAPAATPSVLIRGSGQAGTGMRQVTALVERPDGQILALGFLAPDYPEGHQFPPGAALFTTATQAVFGASEAEVVAGPVPGQTVALPLGAVYRVTPPAYLRGDSDGSGAVNNFDIDAFVLAISNPSAYMTTYCAGQPDATACLVGRNDLDRSGAVNNFDIDAFVACLNALPPAGQACP